MLSNIFAWLFKGKIVKAGVGTVGASGVIALVFGLHDDITKKIVKVEATTKVYVDLKHSAALTEVVHLKEGQGEIKDMLKTIDRRLYELKKRE